MDWGEIGEWLGAAVVIAAIIIFPRLVSFRHRAITGAVLFPLGWVGVFGGLALDDRPFMQSGAVPYIWIGSSALAILLGIVLLVPVLFEWRRRVRKPKYKK